MKAITGKTITGWLLALVAGGAILGTLVANGNGASPQTAWHRPELDYLKAVNRAGPSPRP